MRPTLGRGPKILYCSYAYTDREDVKIGDIVIISGPNYNRDRGTCMVKRVAALEGARLRLTPRKPRLQYRYAVGDNLS